ncbi:predicted protein [Uncinocarpus reesii 1704]|uniref:Uncharacterized protein n=1 Tax=Uncinocarpus reesii (strain UAMH 1704) TaxID=336963 RepID=C4JRX5_UNCRE|nr:uncharacterized protein UREG_05214 [Uncinocarpus reesii 1704]EEP80372.1 predicted protein [Uncinocarpus reesii 1704]
MQSLWFRSTSSTCTCRCLSCLSTISNAVSNRAATAASRRRLLVGNGIATISSSIFATAVVVDAELKTKRRLEREKEIAAVKAEVDKMKEDELRILESLARSRWRPVRGVTRPARRQYSTAANPMSEYARYLSQASQLPEEQDNDSTVVEPPSDPAASCDPETEEFRDMEQNPCVKQFSDLRPGQIRAMQLLAMKVLGIQLLLRPSIAHTYGVMSKLYTYDSPLHDISVDKLLSELQYLRKRLTLIKYTPDGHYADICDDITLEDHDLLLKQRDAATFELRKMFNLYQHGGISLDNLIARVSEMLVSAKEPIPPRAIEILISQFSRARLNDVVKMVMETLFLNAYPLTVPVIISSLNWFNKTKDLSGFDQFLNKLQNPDPFINLQLRWHSAKFGGIEVAVPPNSTPNPFILNTLISCALTFDQPQRADAWLDVLRATGFSDTVPTLGAYLRYYSFQANWKNGRHVLMRVIFYLLSSKNHPVHEIERLILYMIILCECCSKPEIADSIISAAVSSGIRWQLSASERDARPALLWAAQKWRDASIYAEDGLSDLSPGEKYVQFARNVEPTIRRAVEEFIPEDDLTIQRLRLEESFNMKYYKLISDHNDKPSRRACSQAGNESSLSEIESTRAELQKLQGMVRLQNAVIAKLEGFVTSQPEIRDKVFGPQNWKPRGKTKDSPRRNPGGVRSNPADNKYRLVSIFKQGNSESPTEEPEKQQHENATSQIGAVDVH